MDKIRIGIIGCGAISSRNGGHVKALLELSDKLIVTAVCDSDKERLNNAVEAFDGQAKGYADFTEMVDDVDAVLIALPHDLHYSCGMFFLMHDKHVLMEKPLANSEQECLNMIEEAKKRNLKLMCAYPVRFWPEVIKMRELIDSGKYGKVFHVCIWTEQRTLMGDPNDPLNWGHTARLGGGQFFSHGCHYVDALLYLLGEPIKGIHFGTRTGTPWLIGEGTSDAIMEFEGGVLAYHTGTWGAAASRMGYDFQIHCEKALIEYDLKNGKFIIREGMNAEEKITVLADKKANTTTDGDMDKNKKRLNLEIEHFVDCIINDTTPITDATDALQSLRVIWKMYDAEKTGTVADLRGLGLKYR